MSNKNKYRAIMVAGTGSHVGKSVLVMGLCRIFQRRGLDVAPFKAQNMALNSGITPEGGEMGRAQISQAEAAGLPPHVDMNPILLKPTGDMGSQVVLNGKVAGNYRAADYYKLKPRLINEVMEAYSRLAARHELVVLEGAGSAAELNLLPHDLVNLPMAQRAGARVLLAADIDAGGVFAQVLGTLQILPPEFSDLITGVVINKFRGDPELFTSGVRIIEERGGKPVLGVVPYFKDIVLPQEDGVALERGELSGSGGSLRVGVVRLSHISNYTDADALAAEPGVEVRWVSAPEELSGLDLVILPGTKNTLSALAELKRGGLGRGIQGFHAIGGRVLGICGGYQLLGQTIADPLGVEGPPGEQEGLGLLPVTTTMAGEKTTTLARALAAAELPFACDGEISGYEIHMGESKPLDRSRPAFHLVRRLEAKVDETEGQVSPDGRVVGTYLHGLLDNDGLRSGVLGWALGRDWLGGGADYTAFKDRQYDLLADLLEEHVDVEPLLSRV